VSLKALEYICQTLEKKNWHSSSCMGLKIYGKKQKNNNKRQDGVKVGKSCYRKGQTMG